MVKYDFISITESNITTTLKIIVKISMTEFISANYRTTVYLQWFAMEFNECIMYLC